MFNKYWQSFQDKDNPYKSIKPFCQFAVASKYFGCYRPFLVHGYGNALNLAANNNLILGEILNIEGIVLYTNVRRTIEICDELNQKEGLDEIKSFHDFLPTVEALLNDDKTYARTSMSLYKFVDDCHYADKRYKEYGKMKKITREYYS